MSGLWPYESQVKPAAPGPVVALSASGTPVELIREEDGSIRIFWNIGGILPVAKWFQPEEARKLFEGGLGLLDGG